jgi:hypothetical protein
VAARVLSARRRGFCRLWQRQIEARAIQIEARNPVA